MKREREYEEIMNNFSKVEVNISLLDSIKHIHRYAKFLKELCLPKKKIKGNETIKKSWKKYIIYLAKKVYL